MTSVLDAYGVKPAPAITPPAPAPRVIVIMILATTSHHHEAVRDGLDEVKPYVLRVCPIFERIYLGAPSFERRYRTKVALMRAFVRNYNKSFNRRKT